MPDDSAPLDFIRPPIRRDPRWDGGHAILFFVFSALLSLLLGLVLVDAWGFYLSVILSELIAFAFLPFALSRIFDLGWRTWYSSPRLSLAFWLWSSLVVVAFAVAHSNLPVLLDRIWPIPREQFDFYRQHLAAGSIGEMLLLFIVAAVVPGICEEIAFRGVVQTGLRRSFGPTLAIIGSGAMFAILHLNPWNFIGLWAFGCLLGYMRERTGSILPCIGAHILHNSLALVTFAVQSPEDWQSPPEFIPWYLAGPAVILLVFALKRLHRHSTQPTLVQLDIDSNLNQPEPREVM